MDRLIYTAMAGAKHTLEQQANNSHNLANVSTTGFKAQLDSFRAVPVLGDGLPTRAFVVDATTGADMSPGPIQQTGRSLDVAVQGAGWLAVEAADGSEAYTRAGAFKLNENGVLQTSTGLNVLGDAGPITVPPDTILSIASDGTIAGGDATSKKGITNNLGRLKLVNPDTATMTRGDDGLFRAAGGPAEADANVRVVGGALEGSNVNVVDSMVTMISLARQFELQMTMLKSAESNAAKASTVMSLSS
ncbi:MAG: flagellar basal-body rod protein FlgF [Janthinobacterium lividum]